MAILQGTVKGGKKTRQTEDEVGKQHQGMDRPGVRQVPEGSGEQGKMEETGSEVICGAATIPAVKGSMKVKALGSMERTFWQTALGSQQMGP